MDKVPRDPICLLMKTYVLDIKPSYERRCATKYLIHKSKKMKLFNMVVK